MDVGVALITGGCGFVGRHVLQRLVDDGWEVWVIDDLSTGTSPVHWLDETYRSYTDEGFLKYSLPKGSRIVFVQGDVRKLLSSPQVARKLPQFDLVFHLAAVVGGRMKIDGDPLAVATDLAIDAEFFNWAIKARPARILYASSSAAYPIHLQGSEGHVALREDMIDFDHGRLGMPDMTYGWAKLTGEYLARIAAQKYGLHVACVRPFSGYGEDQDESYPVPAIAARAARREDPLIVWGSGQQGRDFVHIDDCVEAMLRAVEVIGDGSAVNIGSGKLTTFLEVAAIFARLEGYEPEIKPLVNKPVGVQARYADPSKAQKLLGWKAAISIEEGFGRVLEAARRRHAMIVEAR